MICWLKAVRRLNLPVWSVISQQVFSLSFWIFYACNWMWYLCLICWMELAMFHPSWLWFYVRWYGYTLNELDLFHSWLVYECPRSSKWYQINPPKLLNFILDFLQESGERHLHHRPSNWFANLTWFWLVFLLQSLILICCFITNYFQEVSTCKGLSSYFETMKLQERKGNNRNCGGFSGNFVVWAVWLEVGLCLGALMVLSRCHEALDKRKPIWRRGDEGWNRYDIDLWLKGLVSNQGKSIMRQSECCAVCFAHLSLENIGQHWNKHEQQNTLQK